MRRAVLTGVAAGFLLAAAPALAAPAYAAGAPPVPVDDTVTVHAGDGELFDLAANDTDPDGDDVQVCRVADVPRLLQVDVQQGQAAISASPRAHGSYRFTYYACDTSSLVPATVTVTVRPSRPTIDIEPLGRQDRYRIVNTYPSRSFRCTWQGSDDGKVDGKVDGQVTVPAAGRRTVTAHGTTVEFECRSGNVVLGFGFETVPSP